MLSALCAMRFNPRSAIQNPQSREPGMPIPGNLLTTAMAVMPHTDVAAALDAALSLDIPFRPQLPRLNYYEDMYVQASEHFPGIVLDMDKQTLAFSMDTFVIELEERPWPTLRGRPILTSARNIPMSITAFWIWIFPTGPPSGGSWRGPSVSG
jgi:hypothetical protein